MSDLYRKIGRRYHRVGWEFTGFPANGYWQVVDGRQSLIVPAEHPRPMELIRYTRYVNEAVNYVLQRAADRGNGMTGYSLLEAVTWTCEYLEWRANDHP